MGVGSVMGGEKGSILRYTVLDGDRSEGDGPEDGNRGKNAEDSSDAITSSTSSTPASSVVFDISSAGSIYTAGGAVLEGKTCYDNVLVLMVHVYCSIMLCIYSFIHTSTTSIGASGLQVSGATTLKGTCNTCIIS